MPSLPSTNDTDTLRYLLLVLSHTKDFQPDYAAIAREEGLSRTDKARDKLKTKLQHSGYTLAKGNGKCSVIEIGGEDVQAGYLTSTGDLHKKMNVRASKKRKRDKMDGDQDDEEKLTDGMEEEVKVKLELVA